MNTSIAVPAAQQIPTTKSEIISDFANLQPEDVQKLGDRDFVDRMKQGIRTFSNLLQPPLEIRDSSSLRMRARDT
jgi:hypothetical protein